jgi:hypothetical protein
MLKYVLDSKELVEEPGDIWTAEDNLGWLGTSRFVGEILVSGNI